LGPVGTIGGVVQIMPSERLIQSHKPSHCGSHKTAHLFTELCTQQNISHLPVHYINSLLHGGPKMTHFVRLITSSN